MSRSTAEPTGLDGLLYRVAYASARIGVRASAAGEVRTEREPAAGRAAGRRRQVHRADDPEPPADAVPLAAALHEQLAPVLAATAVGSLLGQLLEPRRVHWPRAIVAGTIGTLVYDAETLVDAMRRRRKFGTTAPVWRVLFRGGARAQLGRYAAGVGMAGFYGRFLHGKLPGPGPLQGMAYGLVEAVTRGAGGPVALLERLAPELSVPAAYTRGIAHPDETAAQRLRRHLLFGVVVGVVYQALDDD